MDVMVESVYTNSFKLEFVPSDIFVSAARAAQALTAKAIKPGRRNKSTKTLIEEAAARSAEWLDAKKDYLEHLFSGDAEVTTLGVIGDVHGGSLPMFRAIKATKDAGGEILLQLGDFAVWHDRAGQDYLDSIEVLAATEGVLVVVTLGNHENYDLVETFVETPDGRFWVARPNVLLAKKPAAWVWSGKRFVSYGGAASVDKMLRLASERKKRWRPVKEWWEQELPAYDALGTLGSADVLLTHDTPVDSPLLAGRPDLDPRVAVDVLESQRAVSAAYAETKPELAMHGHLHTWGVYNTLYSPDSTVVSFDREWESNFNRVYPEGSLAILTLV